jgi:hypothetical protein
VGLIKDLHVGLKAPQELKQVFINELSLFSLILFFLALKLPSNSQLSDISGEI